MAETSLKARAQALLEPEVIGAPDCPILHRWVLGSNEFWRRYPVKPMIHHFLPNADDRDVHDHPRPFITVVLRGGYDDMAPCPTCKGGGTYCSGACVGTGVVLRERMRPGMIRRRRAGHAHRTRVNADGCWTFVLMGPLRRPWGFIRAGRWWSVRDYEAEFGFGMRCD